MYVYITLGSIWQGRIRECPELFLGTYKNLNDHSFFSAAAVETGVTEYFTCKDIEFPESRKMEKEGNLSFKVYMYGNKEDIYLVSEWNGSNRESG